MFCKNEKCDKLCECSVQTPARKPTKILTQSHDSENIIHHSNTSSDEIDIDNEHSFVFSARPRPKDKLRFPPTHVIHQLWEAFVENFDPLTKIVHIPSLRPAVERAISDVTKIPRDTLR